MCLSVHLLGKGCSFGYPYVLFVLYLFVIVVVSLFSFECRAMGLIAPVPGHCLPFTFVLLFLLVLPFNNPYMYDNSLLKIIQGMELLPLKLTEHII